MKKIIALTIAGLLAASISAFATDGVGTTDGAYSKGNDSGSWVVTATNVGANVSFTTKLSANVFCAYKADTTAGLFYSMGTAHASGNKSYGTASGESRIFMKELTTAGTPETIPAAAADNIDWTGWTAVK